MSDQSQKPQSGFRIWTLIPALAGIAVLALFLAQLGDEAAQRLPSALIGKPSPEIALPGLLAEDRGLATADLNAPGVKLVNIWASWCGPCRAEHPQIMALAARGITVHGLNYKDRPDQARTFLAELGDPYTRIGVDAAGRAALDFGVYGVPETFVIDSAGQIVFKHVGPLMPGDVEGKLLPAIRAASGG